MASVLTEDVCDAAWVLLKVLVSGSVSMIFCSFFPSHLHLHIHRGKQPVKSHTSGFQRQIFVSAPNATKPFSPQSAAAGYLFAPAER